MSEIPPYDIICKMKNEGITNNELLPTKERSPDYPKILTEIEEALNTGKEVEYIKKRISSLVETAEKGEMSHISHSVHHGFIGPEMMIRRTMMVDPVTLDDDGIYTELFETIKLFKNTQGWKDKTIREIIPTAIQITVVKYFGNIASYDNTESKNREFYLDHSDYDSKAVSIKELKGKGFAVCAEKASAAENLLAFVGLDSDIIASNNCRLPSDSEETPHYFILIHAPKACTIYDPTNPVLVSNEKREVITCTPAIYQISDEQAKSLISGGALTVEHVDEGVDINGNKVYTKSSRTYSGPGQN